MLEFLLFADSSGFFLGLLGVILFLISVFLVFIILIQRGKGGGIAGSLTGTAQSAFGARGGDILMWLTLTLTIIWILLCCVTIFFYSRVQDSVAEGREDADIPTDVIPENPTGSQPNAISGGKGVESEELTAPVEAPPAIETNDTESNDRSSEDPANNDEPDSNDTSDGEQQTKDTTSGDKD
ncbi:MAG: preprotein translocase subunit SecG [Planctomycetaceae bacterium]|jgi:preprotein translocase subunit SecG|nr:preprotein translocase subunit SecG [Planctomycetaceae bacterium]MBT4011134.1 preprotein translocase subunit SecG [Planctomycetaceae bacterium]MBT4725075.1 preprotein translocase subunit SecG [Planctomycetaceae bacterium]MBT4846268.1 preprotein translocase subunit SecG [Planctomycetaceae bacterium]MBT5124073.1 preprotein translocase subunit SecG [Planctomycetaceae bacterium]